MHAVDALPGRRHGLSTSTKITLSLAALLVSLGVAVTGTYAAFTASVSRGHQVSSATPVLSLGAVNASTNRLGVDAPNIGPGDSVYRAFDLTNSGTAKFTAVGMGIQVTTASLLTTDATNGLQATLERCTGTGWVESGTSPNFTYTCSGTRSTVVPKGAVATLAATTTATAGLQALLPGGTDHLLLTETLPATADNTFQSLTSSLTYIFNAST